MHIDELYYAMNNGSLDDLLPLARVVTEAECLKYVDSGYQVLPLSQIKKLLPNVLEEDYQYLCYQWESLFPEILYYDLKKGIFFFTGLYVTNNGAQFTSTPPGSFANTLARLKKRILKLKDTDDYNEIYSFVPTAYRMEYMCKSLQQVPDSMRYEVFIKCYCKVDFGRVKISQKDIQLILDCKLPAQKEKTTRELNTISFEDSFPVFRGEGDRSTKDGFSYTLDENVARDFAFKNSASAREVNIVSGKVKREDIIEYIPDHGEAEIFTLSDKVYDKTRKTYYGITEIKEDLHSIGKIYMKQLDIFKRYIANLGLNEKGGDHGCQHLKRVLFLSIILAKHYKLNKLFCQTLYHAAMLHDIGRDHDGEDECHGLNSYNLVASHDEILGEDELFKNLLVYHCLDDQCAEGLFVDTQEQLAYRILKDADALDRQRFGSCELDTKYLRLEYSKDLVFAAFQLSQYMWI